MKIHKAYKTELKPNNIQTTKLLQHCGCARFTYNWALGLLKDDWNSGTKELYPNAMNLHKLLVSKKKTADLILA